MSIELKPRQDFLDTALACGATLTGKPDGSEAITVVFTIDAWRKFDTAIKQSEARTDEPVYQICRAESVSICTAWVNVQKQQYEDAALYPEYVRRVLYTHTAPGVPDALKDHQIAAMVNTLRDIARQFHGHDSLRERIANVLVPALKAEAQQPASGVPDDVVRDAERYRWLKAYYHNSEDMGICKWVDEGWSGQWVLEHDPDTSIDAAMLAASNAQKGD